MRYRISDLIEDYSQGNIPLEECHITSADRIRVMTMAQLGINAAPVRRGRKLGRTLLIAAVFVLALAASAVAVYQYSLRDAVIEDTLPAASAEESKPARRSALSFNGFKDSPEYQAYVEWTAWNDAWEAENPNWFNDHGVDDSYRETPDNYANFYDAYSHEQGEKLDEIMAKYGLTPHTDRTFFDSQRQLCRALDAEDIIAGEQYKITGEYIYDDGSFKALAPLNSMRLKWAEIFVAVKGSFSLIYNSVPQGEEWSYTADDGTEVIMAAYDTTDKICVIAGLEGCYVAAFIDTADRAEAEAFADSIQWKTLNSLFATEKSRQAAAQSVARFREAPTTDGSVFLDEGGELVAEILGNYYLTNLPETVSLYGSDYSLPDEYDDYFFLRHNYQGQGIGIHLSFRNLKEGETELKAEDLALPYDERCVSTTVNGYDALRVSIGDYFGHYAYHFWWLDTDRELVFHLETSGLTLKEAEALAGGITAEHPDWETGSQVYAARAAQRQEEIDALQSAQKAEQEAWEAEYNAYRAEELQSALEKLGDFSVTAKDCVFDRAEGSYVETDFGELIYAYITKVYTSPVGEVWMTYERVETRSLSSRKDSSRESVERLGGGSYLRDVTINGCDGYIEALDNGVYFYILTWLDKEHGLMFSLQPMSWSAPENVSDEDIIALAESVSAQ